MIPTRSTLDPGTAIGGYVVEQLLGHGGMADVYLAADLAEHRRVALKVLPADADLDPKRRQRLLQEGRILQALRHPHICAVYEVGECDGRAYVAMEYVEGETLHDLADRDRLSVPRIIAIGEQLASALEAARQSHVVHRDLKGSNIMVMPSGDVKILDFGLAKFAAATDRRLMNAVGRATDPGLVFGTAEFMSPEQALGREVDHRSDLFSLGVLLYELLTGRLPFRGGTKMDLFWAIVNAEPPSIAGLNPDVSPAVAAVVGRLLEKSTHARYQSAEHVRADLEAARPQFTMNRDRRRTVQLQWFRRLAGSTLGILAAMVMVNGVQTLSALADDALDSSPMLAASVWTGTNKIHDLAPLVSPAVSPSAVWIGNDGRVLFGTRHRNGARTLWASVPGKPEASVIAYQADGAAVAVNGRTVFFTGSAANLGLFKTSMAGGAPERLVAGVVEHPTVAPDGRTVVFSRPVSGGYTLWAVPTGGGNAYQISPLLMPSAPLVSPDLTRLAFAQADGVLVCEAPHCTNSVRLPVTTLVGWAPDGEGLAHTGAPGSANIWVTRIDTGSLQQVTRFTDQVATSISWSPDGHRMAVTRQRTLADFDLFRSFR